MNRRQLARELTSILNASTEEILAVADKPPVTSSLRIGITGAPGVGKSSVIARLGALRVQAIDKLAVLAIDPSSPCSGGSLLGDRIRMDALADNLDVYIRSLPSRSATDGLCNNIPALIQLLEGYGFSEIILETVGVGQAEYAIRNQVDTMILIMQPESGDTIQSMKAGVVELADILVVNKSDLPGAEKVCAELEDIAARGGRSAGWLPPVIKICARDDIGIASLSQAISRHVTWQEMHRDNREIATQRRRYQLQSLLERRIGELIDNAGSEYLSKPLPDSFKEIARLLAAVEPQSID